MSEAALAPSLVQSQRLASARFRRNHLNSLEALERGFMLFKSTFARDAWLYYAGAAPLLLCFIPMWVADGQIRLPSGTLLAQAVLLAGAYLLRAWMLAGYVQRVRQRAFGAPVLRPKGVAAQAAFLGRLLAWKISLSVAALATLPTIAGASWLYGACQFAGIEAREDAAERHSFGACLSLSSQWFVSGLLFFLMLFPLWIAVWLNGFMLAVLLPRLLHSIFGLNTLLSTSMGYYALIRSSAFWLSLFAGAWLALDPVVKCTFVVVYQHLRSKREGDDLRSLLASLPREQKKKAEMLAASGAGRAARIGASSVLALILLATFPAGSARVARASAVPSVTEAPSDAARQARVQELRQALDQESRRAIYLWHDADHPSPPTWFDTLLAKIDQALERAWDALWNFLRKLWPRQWDLSPGKEKSEGWRLQDLRLWLILIVILTLAAALVLFWRRQRRETVELSAPLSGVPFLDMNDAAVATQRSEDEWFTLANQLEKQGELRLALRAAYLGLLAGLAQREWLTIRRDRTNREYLEEFTRRWRRRPQAVIQARTEIPEKLRGSLRLFDRVWYGSLGLTPAAVAAYRHEQRELLNHV